MSEHPRPVAVRLTCFLVDCATGVHEQVVAAAKSLKSETSVWPTLRAGRVKRPTNSFLEPPFFCGHKRLNLQQTLEFLIT